MVDYEEQYSRRRHLVIMEIATIDKNITDNDDQRATATKQKTSLEKDTIGKNIEKRHPIGKPKQGIQQQIIKFKTDSFKEFVYRRHKSRIKMTKQNQRHGNANVGTKPNGIEFKSSLTKRRINLLE